MTRQNMSAIADSIKSSQPQQPEMPQIPAAVSQLHSQVTRAQGLVLALVERLEPVASTYRVERIRAAVPETSSTVPLASAIQEHATALDELNAELEVLLGGLQL